MRVEAALALQRALAWLTGIARAVERREPSAHDDAAAGFECAGTAYGCKRARSIVERERYRRESVFGRRCVQYGGGVACGAPLEFGIIGRRKPQPRVERCRDDRDEHQRTSR